jgi:hypothetical protein
VLNGDSAFWEGGHLHSPENEVKGVCLIHPPKVLRNEML